MLNGRARRHLSLCGLLLVIPAGACQSSGPSSRSGHSTRETEARAAAAGADQPADSHDRAVAGLRAFEDARRRKTDFAHQVPGNRAFGPNPYQVAWLPAAAGADSNAAHRRAVGILRGADAVVLLDQSGHELDREPAPATPTSLMVDPDGLVWVGGTGSNQIGLYRMRDATLVRVGTRAVAGAFTVRALARGGPGWVYAADERTGQVAALALAGRAGGARAPAIARQRLLTRCNGPIQMQRGVHHLVVNCLKDHTLEAFAVARSGAPVGDAPVRITHDGPLWSLAVAGLPDGRELIAAGGVEDHPLERRDGGFGYIDSFLYVYDLGSAPEGNARPRIRNASTGSFSLARPTPRRSPLANREVARRLAVINLSQAGVVTPKWVTIELPAAGGAVVRTAGYATAKVATVLLSRLEPGAAAQLSTGPLLPGTTARAMADATGPALVADPLLDAWLVVPAGGGAPVRVGVAPAPGQPTRSVESRVGEALFFTRLMAPWNTSEGKRSRFTCETCHFEANGDGRVHFTGRGEVYASTKPLRGLFNNRPHFSRALDRSMAQMVNNEFRVANRFSGRSSWFTVDAGEVPWLDQIQGAPAALSPVMLRRSLMTFLMEQSFEPNQAVRGRSHLTARERAGAALFRDRCTSCHSARLVTDDPVHRGAVRELGVDDLLAGRSHRVGQRRVPQDRGRALRRSPRRSHHLAPAPLPQAPALLHQRHRRIAGPGARARRLAGPALLPRGRPGRERRPRRATGRAPHRRPAPRPGRLPRAALNRGRRAREPHRASGRCGRRGVDSVPGMTDISAERPPRVRYRVPVAVLCSEAHVRLTGNSHNLSEGGMFVESQRLLPVGTSVRLGLALARHSVELFGQVAWSRSGAVEDGRGMGIRFVAVRPETGALLRDVVGARVASVRQRRASRRLSLPLPAQPEPEAEPAAGAVAAASSEETLRSSAATAAAEAAAAAATGLPEPAPPARRGPGRAALAFLFVSVATAVAILVAAALFVHGPPPR